MPSLILPFEQRKLEVGGELLLKLGLYPMLPKRLKEVSRENLFLLEYLHLLPIEEIGIPKYYDAPTRSLSEDRTPNIIYPVPGGTFTHIYPDMFDERNIYIPIEPMLTLDLNDVMPEIEKKLMDFTEELADNETVEEKTEAFRTAIGKICIAVSDGERFGKSGKQDNKLFGFKGKWYFDPDRILHKIKNLPKIHKKILGKALNRIQLTQAEVDAIKYLVVRDKVGVGVLEHLVHDLYVEDISCAGVGFMFIEHKIFKGLKTATQFDTNEELDQFVMRLSERVKRPVTLNAPIVDATLPDGARINIVYGEDVSRRGSNFTIRRFSEKPTSVLQVIEFGTMSYQMAAYLSLILEENMNVFVAGETASGKTTTLNAITTFIKPECKIISIEDTPELQVPHANWLREVSRESKEGQKGSAVGMFELLKAALRQRPNMIIIGEIRGEEGNVAFQAMQTGHGVMSTFHAASVEKLIQRLTGAPISVPKTYIDNLNVVIIQSAVRLSTGKPARRVISVSELVGYDPPSESFSFIEVFHWNPSTDVHDFTGNMNSYLLEQKLAPKRGLPPEKKRQIYSELNRRTRILERLHKEKGITDFYELLSVLGAARREGIF